MKRYLVFIGNVYYPDGGFGDFAGDYDSEKAAIELSLIHISEPTRPY